MWDKPKQRVSKKAWEEEYGFEDGPKGGYQPNMSEEDNQRWKAKIVGTKTGFPQVEIRKQAGPSLMTLIVNLGRGYNYKYYKVVPEEDTEERYRLMGSTTTGLHVHLSMNGPSQMTFQDMADMQTAIQEAREKLEELEGVKGEIHGWVARLTKEAVLEDVSVLLDAMPTVKVHYGLMKKRLIVFSAPNGEAYAMCKQLPPGVVSVESLGAVREAETKQFYARLDRGDYSDD